MQTFGERFKSLRERKSMTQDQLVDDFNSKFFTSFNKSTISQYENNKRKPEVNILESWASYFNTSIDYLLGRTDVESSTTNITKKDEKDIEKALNTALEQLEHSQEGLMFSGEPLDDETRELLKISLENSMRLAKQIAKKKFTPKKYK